MPGKTYIPRTTMSAGSNRINSNFANKLQYNPVVKAMRSRIDSLETARSTLIEVNNQLITDLSNASSLDDLDVSLNKLIIDEATFTLKNP